MPPNSSDTYLREGEARYSLEKKIYFQRKNITRLPPNPVTEKTLTQIFSRNSRPQVQGYCQSKTNQHKLSDNRALWVNVLRRILSVLVTHH